MNPDVNAFQRKFVNEVRRCDEMERKLRKFNCLLKAMTINSIFPYPPLIQHFVLFEMTFIIIKKHYPNLVRVCFEFEVYLYLFLFLFFFLIERLTVAPLLAVISTYTMQNAAVLSFKIPLCISSFPCLRWLTWLYCPTINECNFVSNDLLQ